MKESYSKNSGLSPKQAAAMSRELKEYAQFRFEQEIAREKSIVSRIDGSLTALTLSLASMTPFFAFLPNAWEGVEKISFLFLSVEWAISFFACLFFLIKAQSWGKIRFFPDVEEWQEILKKEISQPKGAPSDDIIGHSPLLRAYRNVQKSIKGRNDERRETLSHAMEAYPFVAYFFFADVAVALLTSAQIVQNPIWIIVAVNIPALACGIFLLARRMKRRGQAAGSNPVPTSPLLEESDTIGLLYNQDEPPFNTEDDISEDEFGEESADKSGEE